MGMCCHHHFNHRECEHCLSLGASDDRIKTTGFSMVPTSPWRTSHTVPSPGTYSGQQLPYYTPDSFIQEGKGECTQSPEMLSEKTGHSPPMRSDQGFWSCHTFLAIFEQIVFILCTSVSPLRNFLLVGLLSCMALSPGSQSLTGELTVVCNTVITVIAMINK